MLTICHNFYNIPSNNKSNKDITKPYNRKRYIFGIFILVIVSVLWVVSSELTKYIYTELKLERPFLLTYIRSSLLFVYLIILCFSPPTKDPCRPTDYTQLLEPCAETDDENYFNESTNSLGDSTFVPVRAGETTDSDDAAPRAVRFNKVAEVRVMSASQAGEALLARLSWAASVRASEYAQRRAAAAATRRHLRLALLFAVPWFTSNYLYRLSLLHTTTGVATVYVSMTDACALSLGAIFSQVPGDRFNLLKITAVLMSTAALVMLGTIGSGHGDWTAVLAALGSALCYAIHLVIFRRELRKTDGINSPLLAGLVGCACLALWWAAGAALSALGGEKIELPPSAVTPWLLLDAVIGPVTHEALWIWGNTLTSPQTATWSLTLVIPLPVIIDLFRGRVDFVQVASVTLATLGWALSVSDSAGLNDALSWLRSKFQTTKSFSSIRNIPDLDEQSEALIPSDEPT